MLPSGSASRPRAASRRPSPRLLPLLLLLCLCLGSPGLAQDATPPPTVRATDTLERAQVERLQGDAQTQLEAIPADATEDSRDGQRRLVLTRRLALAKEFLDLERRVAALPALRDDFEKRRKEVEKQLANLGAPSEGSAPASPNQEGFDELSRGVARQRERIQALRTTLRELQGRREGLPGLLQEQRDRAAKASKRVVELSGPSSGEGEDETRRLVEQRIENARLDRQIAQGWVDFYQAESEAQKGGEPVLEKEIDLAQRRLARLEADYERYRTALAASLESAKKEQERLLARDQEKARRADTEEGRLLAEWQARIALSRKLRSDTESSLLVLRSEVADQDKRLATEQQDLVGLKELLSQSGGSTRAAERIKTVFRNLERRRHSLRRISAHGYESNLEAHRNRRFEIDDILIDLAERSQEDLERVLPGLPEEAREAFRSRAEALVDETRPVLREEKGVLSEAILEGQRLQGIVAKRYQVLSETDLFIRSRAFWLQDAPSLFSVLWTRGGPELQILQRRLLRLGAREVPRWLASLGSTSVLTVNGLLLLLLLPGVLLLGRWRLGVAAAAADEDATEGLGAHLRALFLASVRALLIPAYGLVLSLAALGTGGPESPAPLLSQVLRHLALTLLLLEVTRAAFRRKRGLATAHFGLPEEASAGLYRASQAISIGYLVLLLPWRLLSRSPFLLEVLPRVAFSLFSLVSGVAVVLGFRRVLEVLARETTDPSAARWLEHRATLWKSLAALILGTVLLDDLGYRYSSSQIAESLGETLAILLLVPAAYVLARKALELATSRLIEQAPRPVESEEGAPSEPGNIRIWSRRARALLRSASVLVGLVLVAGAWGLNQGALEALARVRIFSSTNSSGVEIFLTAADVSWSGLILGLTALVAIYFPGFCETIVFPRLGMDRGLSYAAQSLLRYGLVILGTVFALDALHIDVGKLGWLMGALSVGLGFGLQEIVSNFVCGLILLIERPVRVGDLVSVGGKVGTVTRINIRATTILNFDRQEEILPNRSFITGEVTNWTRGDTINRVVIPIGVAYGSDVDRVSELLAELARANPQVLTDPAPSVVFVDHGDSALLFNLRVFVPSPKEMMTTKDQLNKAINKALAKEGIEIPFPQRDLHIRSSDVPLVASPADPGGNPIPTGSDSES